MQGKEEEENRYQNELDKHKDTNCETYLNSSHNNLEGSNVVPVISLNYAVIILIKNDHWHPTRPSVLQMEVRGECVCHDRWVGSSLCVVGRWHSRAALTSHPGFLLPGDEPVEGRSLQASFTEAAGNNIVPTFGCVRSHISGCSIRNRPQCGTINPWPQQQICAVTAECGTINQT